jgi:hypothetical protein
MDEETQPQLFENPPQPETPEALRQRRKNELFLRALSSKDKDEIRRLTAEWTDLLLEEINARAKC